MLWHVDVRARDAAIQREVKPTSKPNGPVHAKQTRAHQPSGVAHTSSPQPIYVPRWACSRHDDDDGGGGGGGQAPRHYLFECSTSCTARRAARQLEARRAAASTARRSAGSPAVRRCS